MRTRGSCGQYIGRGAACARVRAAKAPSRERADALSSLGVAMAEINSTGYRENGDGHGDELSQARASGKMAMGERRGTREECKDVRAKMVEGRYARCSSKQKKNKRKQNGRNRREPAGGRIGFGTSCGCGSPERQGNRSVRAARARDSPYHQQRRDQEFRTPAAMGRMMHLLHSLPPGERSAGGGAGEDGVADVRTARLWCVSDVMSPVLPSYIFYPSFFLVSLLFIISCVLFSVLF